MDLRAVCFVLAIARSVGEECLVGGGRLEEGLKLTVEERESIEVARLLCACSG